ncbi:hypothetical protein GDO81_003669 [Engystomops pustulosus]|uniref:Uncharacterized protein n=1 Tax=Engystomops pustulosus TaxID=76066 RepID=A0AAV6ZXQ6_ENGPU|nr:hypothetical protein GDO81_003669 [Engystomops pustulosus]
MGEIYMVSPSVVLSGVSVCYRKSKSMAGLLSDPLLTSYKVFCGEVLELIETPAFLRQWHRRRSVGHVSKTKGNGGHSTP